MVVYGYLPMMVSAQCVQKNLNGCNHSYSLVRLKDRMGKYFPVKSYCTSCYSVIYNSLPLGLVKEADEIRSMHPAAVRLNFTIETLEETKKSPLRLLERTVKESQFRPNRNIPASFPPESRVNGEKNKGNLWKIPLFSYQNM